MPELLEQPQAAPQPRDDLPPWRDIEPRIREALPALTDEDRQQFRTAYEQGRATGTLQPVDPHVRFSQLFNRTYQMPRDTREQRENVQQTQAAIQRAREIHQIHGHDPAQWNDETRREYDAQQNIANSQLGGNVVFPAQEPFQQENLSQRRIAAWAQRHREASPQNQAQDVMDFAPFARTGFNIAGNIDTAAAQRRIDEGKGTDQDYSVVGAAVAHHEDVQRRGTLLETLRHVPATVTELATPFGVSGAIGERAAAAAASRGWGWFGQAAAGVGGRAAGLVPTALLPGAAEHMVQRNIEEGRDPFDPRQAPSSLLHTGLQAIAFESLGLLGTGAGRAGIRGVVQRGLARTGIGMTSQEVANAASWLGDRVIPDAYRMDTRYGALGSLFREGGEPGKEFLASFITNVAFAGLHGLRDHGPEAHERLNALADRSMDDLQGRINELYRQGVPRQEVIGRLAGTFGGHEEPQGPSPGIETPPQATPAAPGQPPTAPEPPGGLPVTQTPPDAAPTQPAPRTREVIERERADVFTRLVGAVTEENSQAQKASRGQRNTLEKARAEREALEQQVQALNQEHQQAAPLPGPHAIEEGPEGHPGWTTYPTPERPAEPPQQGPVPQEPSVHPGSRPPVGAPSGWESVGTSTETPADVPMARRGAQHGFHLHPAQGEVAGRASGWILGEDAHWQTYPEQMAHMSDVELAHAAARDPLPTPPGAEKAPESFHHNWDIISRLWPEAAARVKEVRLVDLSGIGKRGARAAISENGILYVPEHGEMRPDSLWHELVHTQQKAEGRWQPQLERTREQHLEMEREAYSRASQMTAAKVWERTDVLADIRDLHQRLNKDRGVLEQQIPAEAVARLSKNERAFLFHFMDGESLGEAAAAGGWKDRRNGFQVGERIRDKLGLDPEKTLAQHLGINTKDVLGIKKEIQDQVKKGKGGKKGELERLTSDWMDALAQEQQERKRGREPSDKLKEKLAKLRGQLAQHGATFAEPPPGEEGPAGEGAERKPVEPPSVPGAGGGGVPGEPAASGPAPPVEGDQGPTQRHGEDQGAPGGGSAAGNELRSAHEEAQNARTEAVQSGHSSQAAQESLQEGIQAGHDAAQARAASGGAASPHEGAAHHEPTPEERVWPRFGQRVSREERSVLPGGGQSNAGDVEPPQRETALANARIDAERQQRGQPPLMSEARRENAAVWDQAMERLARDPQAGANLVEELSRRPRATTVDENALLLHRRITLQNEHERAILQVIADGRPGEHPDAISMAQHEAHEAEVRRQLEQLERVTRDTGTEWGRAGQFRRQLAKEDFSLSSMLNQFRGAARREPTPEEQSRIAALQEQIAALTQRAQAAEASLGNLGRGATAGEVAGSPEVKESMASQAAMRRAQGQFTDMLDRGRFENKPLWEKAFDLLREFRRFEVLSGPATVAKLTGAAINRLAINPIREAIGSGLRQIPGIREVAARAPTEGAGFSLGKEAKTAKSLWADGIEDSVAKFKTGKSVLDLAFGQREYPALPKWAAWMRIPGQIHAALKAPVERAGFTRSFLSRLEKAKAQGEDVTSPASLARHGALAFLDAERDIFMQPNVVTDWVNQQTAALRRRGMGGSAIALGIDVVMPIKRVPTNIVGEIMQHVTGSITGSVGLARAWKNGINNLQPAQADLIMRRLKSGGVGAAALALGYFSPGLFGGFYFGKYKKDEPEAGSVAGAPPVLFHHPLYLAGQLGATVRRAEDQTRRGEARGLGEGLMQGASSLVEETPFGREITEAGRMLSDRERGYAVGEFMKSLSVPMLIQWLAKRMEAGDLTSPAPTHRPQDVLQHIQTGIPGMRQDVPTKTPRQLAPRVHRSYGGR